MVKTTKALLEKFEDILDGTSDLLEGQKFDKVENDSVRAITARLMENQIAFMKSKTGGGNIINENADTSLSTGNISGWTPVLIQMVRRTIPALCAHELVGLQPMSASTGSVFAFTPTYGLKQAPNNAALFGAPDTAYSGVSSDGTDGWDDGSGVAPSGTGPVPGGPVATDYEMDPFAAAGFTTGTAMDVLRGEGCVVPSMSFEVEKVTVTARTRKLMSSFSMEAEHDLRQEHGLDVEQELASVTANQLVADINAELMRTIIRVAKTGAQDTAVPGVFDAAVDSTGRFTEERIRDLVYQIEKEANKIAFETHAGKANWIMVTANIASALSMQGLLSARGEEAETMDVNAPQSCYAGMLNGKYKVFVDPYNDMFDYVVVGLKVSDRHAGLYYAPYVPFDMREVTAECSGNKKYIFHTRYGVVSNPFVKDAAGNMDGETLAASINPYFRKFAVRNLV